MVKNRLLFGASGELPPTECWPEVWVMEDGDEDRAREIIEAVTAAGEEGPGWTCPGCGEQLDPVFTQCWNCGRERS